MGPSWAVLGPSWAVLMMMTQFHNVVVVPRGPTGEAQNCCANQKVVVILDRKEQKNREAKNQNLRFKSFWWRRLTTTLAGCNLIVSDKPILNQKGSAHPPTKIEMPESD